MQTVHSRQKFTFPWRNGMQITKCFEKISLDCLIMTDNSFENQTHFHFFKFHFPNFHFHNKFFLKGISSKGKAVDTTPLSSTIIWYLCMPYWEKDQMIASISESSNANDRGRSDICSSNLLVLQTDNAGWGSWRAAEIRKMYSLYFKVYCER